MISKHQNHILESLGSKCIQIHKTKNRKWKERKKTTKFEISNEKQVRVHTLPILNFMEAVSSIVFVDIAFELKERERENSGYCRTTLYFNIGSVWIQIILLKTKNWKHCSKIIFECVKNYCSLFFLLFICLGALKFNGKMKRHNFLFFLFFKIDMA